MEDSIDDLVRRLIVNVEGFILICPPATTRPSGSPMEQAITGRVVALFCIDEGS